jgi:hypothetical protein
MGSFNVTCCVTKTPIVPGDRCIVVGINSKDAYTFICPELVSIDLLTDKFNLKKGVYYDYGRLEGIDEEFVDNSEKLIHEEPINYRFYISHEAWKFGEKLIKNVFNGKAYENCSHNVQILCCLRVFCSQNNFNMFDPSFDNCYGGQCINLKEKKQFNKLRETRMKKLKKCDY